ncbi:pilus assembly protein TadG-related protein [Pseudomonas syringae]|uniref:Membrane protein n=1 Tax=Pseudomonas syringae TaxID=317 RepID=A0A085V8Z2_PSESX|nr:pilus assembly protein TadG-related protein [Pseudomonas syringae]KFE51905.1 membrane protein [Pseudomonas syringae]
MSPLNRYVCDRGRQCGAIGLLAAITLALAALCMLVVVDSGRLFLEKRSLQRVADVAALEAASRKGNCLVATGIDRQATTYASQSAIRNGFTPGTEGRTLATHCGSLALDSNSRRIFTADSSKTEAIQVTASHTVPRSIAAGIGAMFDSSPMPVDVQLSATAVAAAEPPLASLSIRSAALVINSTTAPLLNAVIGSMLGGNLNLSAVSWNGIANTRLNLLDYLDKLKTELNLTAVGYDEVLATHVAADKLIQVMLNVLQTSGTLDSRITLADQQVLAAAAGKTLLSLGKLISIQSGTDVAAFKADLGLLDVIQSLAQLANKQNGIAATAQVGLPGLLNLKIETKVIEPPQLSAIGDPSKINPAVPVQNDPNRIYVRTAQMRALVSVDLPVLGSGATLPLLNKVTSLVGSLTPVLNSALGLDIKGLLSSATCLLGASCMVTDFRLLNTSSPSNAGPRIDLSLSLSSAESYVTGYSCNSNTDKSLTFNTHTALVSAKLGLIDEAAAFPASTDPAAIVAKPIPVVNITTQTCTQILGILGNCSTPINFGGGGVGISFNTVDKSPLGSLSSTSITVRAPNLPEIGETPHYEAGAASRLPSTLLDGVVSGVKVDVYKAVTPTILGNVITGAASLLSAVLAELDGIVDGVLKQLLSTVVDPLLAALGVTLAPADVGSNLSCNFGQATLVI